jgi:tRNA(Ile)-lysidine synthase
LSARGWVAKIIFLMSSKSTFQKVQDFIKTESLLNQTTGVVLAVSGGPDSIVLLNIFVRLQKALRKKKRQPQEIKLHIAHLNHQLRGKESDDDAEFVKRLAENLTIPATLETIDIKTLAEKKGKGIEETARVVRYQFLLDTALKTGCNRIATGHTMSDQAETFLMRLVRGAGMRGLASMRPAVPAHQFDKESGAWSRESGVGEQDSDAGQQEPIKRVQATSPPAHSKLPTEIHLIRPLLCITREEVEAYCAQRRLVFRTDSTNQNLDYTRNRLRHEALKFLREVNPRVVEHLAQTAEILAADQDALDELVAGFLEKARLPSTPGQQGEKPSAYSVKVIRHYPAGIRRRLIIEAIQQERTNRSANHFRLSEVEMAHIKAVERLLEDDTSGQRVNLPDGLEVWREFEALVLMQAFNSKEPASLSTQSLSDYSNHERIREYRLTQKEQVIEFEGFSLRIKRRQNLSLLKMVIEQTQEEKSRTGLNWMTVALDDAILPETLLMRTRQAGEKVLVVGQQKIKKLKNLMIDHKIATSRRATWMVVATSDGQYVWSPGLPPAIKFAAHDKTTRLAIIQATNIYY